MSPCDARNGTYVCRLTQGHEGRHTTTTSTGRVEFTDAYSPLFTFRKKPDAAIVAATLAPHSADRVMRADLLNALLDVDRSVHTLPYRGHVLEVSRTGHKDDAELAVDGIYGFPYSANSHDGIIELLAVLGGLDYLIDVLDNVDEPNLKED